ncbi:Hypothetical predicted protein [Cloeon dipterum]|uniref:Uncharacterized protein n=1 Tax=Cloeon dipterum TaxID=197152 RepID=A0A8S1BXR5_9INSE|nr:Hypothetical predicted protein [Cloeon dipterum]
MLDDEDDSLSGVSAGADLGRLYRSHSLPHCLLLKQDSASSSRLKDSGVPTSNTNSSRQSSKKGVQHHGLLPDLRTLLTLTQHYYPEGGWGWVVVVVAMLVQILTHGLHYSFGVLLGEVIGNFGHNMGETAPSYRTERRYHAELGSFGHFEEPRDF